MVHVTLINIARGSVPRLFDRELKRVLENIKDTRTSPRKKRKIMIEFTFSPDDERHANDVEVNASSVLAPALGVKGFLYTSLDEEGQARATLTEPEQLELVNELKEKQGVQ